MEVKIVNTMRIQLFNRLKNLLTCASSLMRFSISNLAIIFLLMTIGTFNLPVSNMAHSISKNFFITNNKKPTTADKHSCFG